MPTKLQQHNLPIHQPHNQTKPKQTPHHGNRNTSDNMKKQTDFCDGCCYRITCDHDLEKCCYLIIDENKCVLESDNQ